MGALAVWALIVSTTVQQDYVVTEKLIYDVQNTVVMQKSGYLPDTVLNGFTNEQTCKEAGDIIVKNFQIGKIIKKYKCIEVK